MFYFLREDFEELNLKINSICEKIREIGKEMGASCQEGAETYHDNFVYEDGERQQYMFSNRLRELIRIKNEARIVTPNHSKDIVSIGRTIMVQDEITGEKQTFKIGSYMVLKDHDAISYASPLARMLIGAERGESREGIVGGRKRHLTILNIK